MSAAPIHNVGSPHEPAGRRTRPPNCQARINLRLAAKPVSKECFQPGESAGLALVMLTEGAALQRLQDPVAPVSPVPQTDWEHLGSVSASGPCRLQSI